MAAKKDKVVNVMRPTKTKDDRGQLQGQDEIVIRNWPCSIEPLSGNKVEQARSLVPTATFRVEGRGNPDKRFKYKDYLVYSGRRLDFEFINDIDLNKDVSILCSEVMLG